MVLCVLASQALTGQCCLNIKLDIRVSKQPVHKRRAQHSCATSSGQDSAVHLHLKESGHSFENGQVRVLERADRWFERGVKKAIHVKL